MVDKDEILELVPYYVALVVIVLVVMGLVTVAIGSLHPLIEFGIILVLVFGYRPLVVRLDAIPTPTIWETFEKE